MPFPGGSRDKALRGSTYQLGIEVPVLRDGLGNALLQEEIKRACAAQCAPNSDKGYHQIYKARSEVEAQWAQRTPALSIAAKGLLRV